MKKILLGWPGKEVLGSKVRISGFFTPIYPISKSVTTYLLTWDIQVAPLQMLQPYQSVFAIVRATNPLDNPIKPVTTWTFEVMTLSSASTLLSVSLMSRNSLVRFPDLIKDLRINLACALSCSSSWMTQPWVNASTNLSVICLGLWTSGKAQWIGSSHAQHPAPTVPITTGVIASCEIGPGFLNAAALNAAFIFAIKASRGARFFHDPGNIHSCDRDGRLRTSPDLLAGILWPSEGERSITVVHHEWCCFSKHVQWTITF